MTDTNSFLKSQDGLFCRKNEMLQFPESKRKSPKEQPKKFPKVPSPIVEENWDKSTLTMEQPPCPYYMGVSKNSDTPKSSILGFSIINHPSWGIPILGNIHLFFDMTLTKNAQTIGDLWGNTTQLLAAFWDHSFEGENLTNIFRHLRFAYLEDHPGGCKWLITMVSKSPIPGVVPFTNGHSWLIHAGY